MLVPAELKLDDIFVFGDFLDFLERGDFILAGKGNGCGAGKGLFKLDLEARESSGDKSVFEDFDMSALVFDCLAEVGNTGGIETLILKKCG